MSAPKNVSPSREEYVLTSGWGDGSHLMNLQIGARILRFTEKSYGIRDIEIRLITESIYENGQDVTRTCWVGNFKIIEFSCLKFHLSQGDSGSPVWQYSDGRAVLIGIMTKFSGIDCLDGPIDYSVAVYVPPIMDWILSVISS